MRPARLLAAFLRPSQKPQKRFQGHQALVNRPSEKVAVSGLLERSAGSWVFSLFAITSITLAHGERTMPMTINVGLSKKVGTANYGSVGASCNVTFEADHNLLEHDLEGFQQRVKNAFAACRQAVQDQLARELNAPASNNGTTNTESAEPTASTSSNGNGASGTAPTARATTTATALRPTATATATVAMADGHALRRSSSATPGNSPSRSRAWASAAWKPSPRRCSASRWRP